MIATSYECMASEELAEVDVLPDEEELALSLEKGVLLRMVEVLVPV
jgi:hypothetical protein